MLRKGDTTAAQTGPQFAPAIASLVGGFGLTPVEANALCSTSSGLQRYAPGEQVLTTACSEAQLIVSGWACELRVLFDGRRQIFSFLMPGDISVSPVAPRRAAFALIALTPICCLELREPDRREPPILAAALRAKVRSNEILRYNALLRVGQLTASERIVHLLLELRDRMVSNGMATGNSFQLPITQVQLGDAVGLSLAHVNRTLKRLRRQSLIALNSGTVTLLQPERLALLADGHGHAIKRATSRAANPAQTADTMSDR
jgi:CRP-like cAMP-binding protein